MDAVELRGHVGALDADADEVDRLVLELGVVGGAIVALGQRGHLGVVGHHAEQRGQRSTEHADSAARL